MTIDKNSAEVSYLRPGSIVEVETPLVGSGARKGARARVVDGAKEFPDLYEQFVDQVADHHLSDFVWVVWDRSSPYHGDQEDGPYHSARFILISEGSVSEPKSNDGRLTCWWCGSPTRRMIGLDEKWDVCEKCGR